MLQIQYFNDYIIYFYSSNANMIEKEYATGLESIELKFDTATNAQINNTTSTLSAEINNQKLPEPKPENLKMVTQLEVFI